MSYQDVMNKVRHWDNIAAKWVLRHFYFMFFQIVLIAIFVGWFMNTITLIDFHLNTPRGSPIEQAMTILSANTSIIAFLLILNSFWMLFIFNFIQRISGLLKDISFNTGKYRFKDKTG